MFAAPLPSFAAAAAAAAAVPTIIFSVKGNMNESKINRQCKNYQSTTICTTEKRFSMRFNRNFLIKGTPSRGIAAYKTVDDDQTYRILNVRKDRPTRSER